MATSETAATPSTSGTAGGGGVGRRGRRPTSISFRTKLERSRQSARECRARKKLRYQYLEELVASREKAIFALRDELKMFKEWCVAVDGGEVPPKLVSCLAQHRQRQQCLSTSSAENCSDIVTEVNPAPAAVVLSSSTSSSSLGSPHQLLPTKMTADKTCPRKVGQVLKTEPADTRWYSQSEASSPVYTTGAATSATASTSVSSTQDVKTEFLGQSMSDTGFDIEDVLSDVFGFDN
jgi:hypothetical protein